MFSGIFVPLVTPFYYSVDTAAVHRLVTHLIDHGIHGLVVAGTTGEASSLEDDEKAMLLDAVVDAAEGRVPILLGLGGSNTHHCVREAVMFETAGIQGYMVSAPAYVRPTQAGIEAHFHAIAHATDLPVVIYNIPARTGVNIEPETVSALTAHPNFVAIKECGAEQLSRLLAEAPCPVLCGDDAQMLFALTHGAEGAIAASAHIRPDLFVRLYEWAQAGRAEEASLLFERLRPLIQLLFSEPNPAPLKAALSMQGLLRDELRVPMLPASAECHRKLKILLEQLEATDPSLAPAGVVPSMLVALPSRLKNADSINHLRH